MAEARTKITPRAPRDLGAGHVPCVFEAIVHAYKQNMMRSPKILKIVE